MIEENTTAQTSGAFEGNAFAGDGNADVSYSFADEQGAEAEFSDTDFEDVKGNAVQSKAQNAENARRRREQEQRRAQAELQRERRAARDHAIIETLDGINPYTGEEMKDTRDVEEYELMKEIERNGDDPISDFPKYLKERERERENRTAREEQQAAWIRRDREAFSNKYPDVDLNSLVEEEEFRDFYQFATEGREENRPLAEIYEQYQLLRDGQTKQARQMAAHMLANKKASPGALASANGGEGGFFTADQVRKMSREEVSKHYEKIVESMRRW